MLSMAASRPAGLRSALSSFMRCSMSMVVMGSPLTETTMAWARTADGAAIARARTSAAAQGAERGRAGPA